MEITMKNILTGALMLTAANAGAVQNIKFGSTLDINPMASISQSYDNNIYLTKSAPKSAWINRTGLGVDFVNRIGSRLDLTGGYTAEFISYSHSPRANDATHQLANLAVEARLPREVVVNLKDNYMLTTDQASSDLTRRVLRVQNTSEADVVAPLRGRFGFNLSAQHIYNNYLATNPELDRQEILAGGDITYKLQPKTKLLLGYRYGTLSYKEAAAETGNSYYNNLDIGITGSIAPKLTGTVKAGAQFRKYPNRISNASDSSTTAGYSAQLVWKPAELTDVIFYGKRGNVETKYNNSRYYTSTVGDITLSREVRKIKAGLGFNYESTSYSEKTQLTGRTRVDTNISLRLTADYNVQKWLKAGAGYVYKSRTSNETGFEYTDSVIGLNLKGIF